MDFLRTTGEGSGLEVLKWVRLRGCGSGRRVEEGRRVVGFRFAVECFELWLEVHDFDDDARGLGGATFANEIVGDERVVFPETGFRKRICGAFEEVVTVWLLEHWPYLVKVFLGSSGGVGEVEVEAEFEWDAAPRTGVAGIGLEGGDKGLLGFGDFRLGEEVGATVFPDEDAFLLGCGDCLWIDGEDKTDFGWRDADVLDDGPGLVGGKCWTALVDGLGGFLCCRSLTQGRLPHLPTRGF